MKARALGWLGCFCCIVAMLPWLGVGGYAFSTPVVHVLLPRLSLFPPCPTIYHIISAPLHLLGKLPVLDQLVFFQGEGLVTVRPFSVALFWMLLAIVVFVLYAWATKEREAPVECGN